MYVCVKSAVCVCVWGNMYVCVNSAVCVCVSGGRYTFQTASEKMRGKKNKNKHVRLSSSRQKEIRAS